MSTGIFGLGVGALWFGPDMYIEYVSVLAERSRVADFAGTVSPNFFAMSLYRPFSQLSPGIDPAWYGPLSILLLVPAAGLVARRSATFRARLGTYLVALIGMLLASPASNALYVIYVYFPVLTLLYLTHQHPHRLFLLLGIGAIAVPIQPAQVAAVLGLLDVPMMVQTPLLATMRTLTTVTSIPLLGLLAILGWCGLRFGRPTRVRLSEISLLDVE